MTPDVHSILADFGLTKKEISVYLVLLQEGELSANEIALKTNTNRTFAYDRLKKLMGIGLASYVIKDNKKYFKAAEPDQLLSVLKEREVQIAKILPELKKIRVSKTEEEKIEVFSTKKGIRSVLNLLLREGKEIFIHGSLLSFKETVPDYFEIWNSRREDEGIKCRVLSYEDMQMPLAEVDLLPEEERTHTTTFIAGNKTITVLWSELPVAVMIENSDIAKDEIALFAAIWKREVKIYSGIDGMRKAFMELLNDTKEYVGYGYSKELADIYSVGFSDQWHIQRAKNKIRSRLVAYDTQETKQYFGPRAKTKKDFFVRYLPRELCGPACVTLSDKMVVTFIYTEKNPKVILNKNKETIKVYKSYFEELWSRSKE